MAFSHRGIGDSDSDDTSSLSREILGAVRWVALPCVAVFFASWSVAALTSLHSAAERASSGSFIQASLTAVPQAGATPSRKQTARAMLAAPVEKSASLAALSPTPRKPKAVPTAKAPANPFAEVVAEAKLSREKLVASFAHASMAIEETSAAESVDPFAAAIADAKPSREKLLAAFARAGMAIEEASAAEPVEVALAMPSAERFHSAAPETRLEAALAEGDGAIQSDASAPLALGAIGLKTELAYATAEASPDSTVELALASLALDPYGMDEEEPEAGEDYMPDAVNLPPAKPETEKPAKADAKPEAKPERKPQETADEPAAPARKPAGNDRQSSQQELAYAKPDKPGVAGAFKNLFDTPKAGNRVAIYDISGGVVHMPDGSKLEAHSGIGKMADNPRYVHVKMNGPTPPNTYRLSMREKRFHGVEAVRMTPVGDQTMHGRTGILAHSYLLRGGRAESHGCVAFKDYPRFLKAFKQGKITHIVVVPSMSKMPKVRLASLGRNT